MAHSKKDPAFVKALGWLFLLAIIALPIYYYSAFEAFAINTFDLTEHDIKMIPVGIVLFFAFWKAMERFVFNPYLNLFEAREKATSGSEDLAQEILTSAKDVDSKFDKEIATARKEAVSKKLDAIEDAKKEAAALIEKAEDDSLAKTLEARKSIESEVEKIRETLNADVDSLSNEIVEKIKTKPQLV